MSLKINLAWMIIIVLLKLLYVINDVSQPYEKVKNIMRILPFLLLLRQSFEKFTDKVQFFLKRPQRFGAIFFVLVLTLLSNVKTLRKIAPNFCGLLRKTELWTIGQSVFGLFNWRNDASISKKLSCTVFWIKFFNLIRTLIIFL